MMRCAFIVAFCLCSSLVFAQLDANSVTVTASRSSNLQPDEALFVVTVASSSSATTLDEAVAALQGTGITQSSLTGVNAASIVADSVTRIDPSIATFLLVQPPALQWRFSLPVPLAKLKDTVALLAALQQSIMKKNNGLTIYFTSQGLQASAKQVQSLSCATSDLLADARAKAQKLADAAGVGVGNVLAMSGDISTAAAGSAATYYSSDYLPSGCSLTVKFALGRF